jgi:hypothetical protein
LIPHRDRSVTLDCAPSDPHGHADRTGFRRP